MPPLVIIALPCEKTPCNISQSVIHLLNNLTSTETPGGRQENYDSEGAARFIIATVLVYSLMGVFTMMLLRIKRSASRARRSTTSREESAIRYIKKADRLMLEARRDVLKREAERTSNRLKLGRQISEESSTSTNPCEFSLSNSLNLSASFSGSHLTLPNSPTSTSLSLLMPLLPTVQETSSQSTENTQNTVPKVVFHFPALPPLSIPQTMITPPLPPRTASSTSISTPVTLVTELNYSLKSDPATNAAEESLVSKSVPDCNMNDTNRDATISCNAGIQNNTVCDNFDSHDND